ncbi:MAG: tetratricopeptide repeat protein [Gemmataceae bacterium]
MSAVPNPPGPRRWGLALLPLTVAAVAGLGWWAWQDRPAEPPAVDLSGADPEVAQAVQEARQELAAAPRSAARWGRLGMVLRAHAFNNEARGCFQQAERLDPSDPRWPYHQGLALVASDPPAGLACLRRAADRLGDGPTAPLYRLAEALLEHGLLDEAQQVLGHADRRESGDVRGRLLRARLAAAREDWKAALALAEGCTRDRRAARQAYQLAADASQRLGDEARARKLIEQARDAPPDLPWRDPFADEVDGLKVGLHAHLARAGALEQSGRGADAVAILERLLRDRPREVHCRVVLGQMLRRQKQLGRAEEALNQAVRLDPDNADGWYWLGVVREDQGRHQPAATAFREAIRLKPDHAQACHHLALCLKAAGDADGARLAWQDALRIQPDHAEARRGLEALPK